MILSWVFNAFSIMNRYFDNLAYLLICAVMASKRIQTDDEGTDDFL